MTDLTRTDTVLDPGAVVAQLDGHGERLTEGGRELGSLTLDQVALTKRVAALEQAVEQLFKDRAITWPDATNTGATGPLTRYPATGDGNLVVTTPGAIIENLDVRGHIDIQAPNVTVRNTIVRGWGVERVITISGRVLFGLITATAAGATGLTVEKCTLVPRVPQYWICGVKSSYDFTVRRTHTYEVVDGIDAYEPTSRLTAEDNYIHDLSFFDNSPDHAKDQYHPGWTHNDCIQLSGGAGHIIRGNSLYPNPSPRVGTPATLRANGYPDLSYGTAITVSPDKGNITDTLITKNRSDGGDCFFQMNYHYYKQATTSPKFGEISHNQVGMGQHNDGSVYQIRYRTGHTIDGLTTNIYDPTAASVPAARKSVALAVGANAGIWIYK